MEIELNRFTPAEQATFRLRALYEQAGYRKYRASRFEEYALYQEYQRFLPDAQVITFIEVPVVIFWIASLLAFSRAVLSYLLA